MTTATDDSTTSRLQLRVPAHLKAQVEAVAAAHGVSANAGAVMLFEAALSGETVQSPDTPPPTSRAATSRTADAATPVGERTHTPTPLPPPAPKRRIDAATLLAAAAVLAVAVPAARVTFAGTADFALNSGAATEQTRNHFPWIVEGSMFAALTVIVARRGNLQLARWVTRVALATAVTANALHVSTPMGQHWTTSIPGRTLAGLAPIAVYTAAELLASLIHNTPNPTPTHRTGNRNGTDRNHPKTPRKQGVSR